jgi:hypothetical protein
MIDFSKASDYYLLDALVLVAIHAIVVASFYMA